MNAQILVVDDENLIRWSLRERLTEEGYAVSEADAGDTALALLTTRQFDLAIVDLRLPGMDGIALLKRMQADSPELPVIIITAYSSVDSAVEALKAGAADYLTKPFNLDELAITVRRTLDNASLRRQLSSHISEQKARFGLDNIIGEDSRMLEIKNLVRRIAKSDATTVLLLGESGTGKDMIARAIHYESNRVDAPFVNITCTALPEALLESELFGYEKGAFTDAKDQKKGLFEFAGGGTVFLDEIADMRPPLQAKLLRVLEDKAFKRIGGIQDIAVNVRVIAATNRDIDTAIRQGRFREDLYYRLSTVPIVLPPLRERRGDIPILVAHFLRAHHHELPGDAKHITAQALDKLMRYDWPGNVRELRNVIERAVLLSASQSLTEEDIVLGRSSLRPRPDPYAFRLPETGCNLAEVERELVQQALEFTQWNQTKAAELLKLSRDQIRYKMEKYNLSREGTENT